MLKTTLFAAMCAIGLAISAAYGQAVDATLTGTVHDVSGAAVPRATVRAVNTGTNLTRQMIADDQGSYTLQALPAGEYRIEAEAPGFKRAILLGVVMQVAQHARIDVRLEIGVVTESITVASTAPLLETERPVIGSVVEGNRILSLPLNGRNFMELTVLTAGINPGNAGSQGFAAGSYFQRGFAPSAAGTPAEYNSYQLDGVDNRESYQHGYNVAPSVDAVQEFRIQVGQYDAEYGGGGGAVVNIVTKSGTNQFHGTAWEFLRNNVLDARNFFLRPNQDIAPLRRNQFGVAAGGPLVRNRTFVFGNFELSRIRKGEFQSGNVPLPEQRSGNLSGFSKTINDPLTGRPFPGNIIPSNRINPISRGITDYWPQATNASSIQNYTRNASSVDDKGSYLIRADHKITDRQQLMGRYGIQEVDAFTPGTFSTVGGQILTQRFQGMAAGLTSIISPAVLNEVRFNYIRPSSGSLGQNTGNPIAANLGVPFAPADPQNAGFLTRVGLSASSITQLTEAQPIRVTSPTFQATENLTLTKGAHALKFGGDWSHFGNNLLISTRHNNTYVFSGQFTGDGFGDFLLGHPSSVSLALTPNLPNHLSYSGTSVFAQDTWQAASNLTLSVGLRYEYFGIPSDEERFMAIFDPTLGSGVGGLAFVKDSTAPDWYRQNRPDLPTRTLDRRNPWKNDLNNFAPRFGFAWRPVGSTRTSIRGGYGIFYGYGRIINLARNTISGPPSQQWVGYTSAVNTPTLSYAGPIDRPVDQDLRSARFGVQTGPEEQYLSPYIQQWSFSLAHTLGDNVSLEAQYMGSKSTHVEVSYDTNFTTPAATPLTARLPYPAWSRIDSKSWGGAANYNALLLSAQKRLSNGLMFRASYTWSKTLSHGGAWVSKSDLGSVQNPADLRAENGRATNNIPHRFVLNYTYQLPVGQGRALGSSWSRPLLLFLGDWSISGLTSIQDGGYLTPSVPTTNCNASEDNPCRPDLLRNPVLDSNGVDSPMYAVSAFDWPLNTAAHARQTPRFGSAGTNILQGNGFINFDLGIHKEIQFNESRRLQLRVESFNFINHANFGYPTVNATSPQFGRTFSTQTDARVNQVALKFYW